MRFKASLSAGAFFVISVLSGYCYPQADVHPQCNERVLDSVRHKRELLPPGQSFQWHHLNLWNYSVAFEFSPDLGKDVKRAYCEAMAIISYASCIKFTPRTIEPDYLVLTDSPDYCQSWVGQRGGAQYVELKNPDCINRGVAMHELLHASGMHHEHQRNDRDQYVSVNWAQIDPESVSNFYRKSRYSSNYYHNATYDFESIMHYGSHAGAIGDEPTLTPVVDLPEGVTKMGQWQRLSRIDIQRVRQLYHCNALEQPLPDINEVFENQLNPSFWVQNNEQGSGAGVALVDECGEFLPVANNSAATHFSGTYATGLSLIQLASIILAYSFLIH
ncbi:MAG: M12 family metallopeptidase [Endozoicomonas sp.]